jgi:hypothetical protein
MAEQAYFRKLKKVRAQYDTIHEEFMHQQGRGPGGTVGAIGSPGGRGQGANASSHLVNRYSTFCQQQLYDILATLVCEMERVQVVLAKADTDTQMRGELEGLLSRMAFTATGLYKANDQIKLTQQFDHLDDYFGQNIADAHEQVRDSVGWWTWAKSQCAGGIQAVDAITAMNNQLLQQQGLPMMQLQGLGGHAGLYNPSSRPGHPGQPIVGFDGRPLVSSQGMAMGRLGGMGGGVEFDGMGMSMGMGGMGMGGMGSDMLGGALSMGMGAGHEIDINSGIVALNRPMLNGMGAHGGALGSPSNQAGAGKVAKGIGSPVGDKRKSKNGGATSPTSLASLGADMGQLGLGTEAKDSAAPAQMKNEVERSIGQLMRMGQLQQQGHLSPDDLDGLAAQMEAALACVKNAKVEAAAQAQAQTHGQQPPTPPDGTDKKSPGWLEEKAAMEAEMRTLRAQLASASSSPGGTDEAGESVGADTS